MVAFAYVAVVAVGLVQLPFLLDVLDAAFPSAGIGRANHAVVSRVLVFLLVMLMTAALWVYWAYFQPHLLASQPRLVVALQVL